jgi:hypothetical protein
MVLSLCWNVIKEICRSRCFVGNNTVIHCKSIIMSVSDYPGITKMLTHPDCYDTKYCG